MLRVDQYVGLFFVMWENVYNKITYNKIEANVLIYALRQLFVYLPNSQDPARKVSVKSVLLLFSVGQ